MEPKPMKQMSAYSFKFIYPKHGNNNCTMKLTDLKMTDASIYYFVYKFKNDAGANMTCKGVPGVRLQVLASPVRILVAGIIGNQTVTEGQRVMLVCVSTCAVNLSPNPGYTWYKNTQQLNGSRENFYVCAMIGYEDLPSSAVSLTVQSGPRNTLVEVPVAGSKEDSQTHGCDAQSCINQNLNNCETLQGRSGLILSLGVITSVCVGLVIAVTTAVLVLKEKRKKKRGCAGSVLGMSNPDTDAYMTLDINSRSAEYDTVRLNDISKQTCSTTYWCM
uniref:Ig-like domain-containing protein n=1 Tax=Lates calcarifer TaxID=8187 RepID=A0A4W6CT92_LATCA